MKKIGDYTTRGAVIGDGTGGFPTERISLFDGRFDTAYRVVEFKIWPSDMDKTDFYGVASKLATDERVTDGGSFNADDNREIGWAYFSTDATPSQAESYDMQLSGIIDPDNLIVEDLFILADHTSSHSPSGLKVNYMIKLEKYDITDWQGALGMVRNKSQG